MRRLLAAGAAIATASAALVGIVSATAGAQSPAESSWNLTQAPSQKLSWSKDCGDYTGYVPNLQCADVTAPLDYAHPNGTKIKLKVSRVKHTAKNYQGVLLLNPGGPGGEGVPWSAVASRRLDPKVAAQYDMIGFDPRGVSQSTPSLNCDVHYFKAPRPNTVPQSWSDEFTYLKKAKGYAKSCAKKYGTNVLKHMNTRDAARDMDTIRKALGQKKINYLGYSYGTYLGSAYATMFPSKVRRLVLDSMIGPNGIWYQDNIDQDYAFDKNFTRWAAWTAKNNATFKLGKTAATVKKKWYALRAKAVKTPIAGKIGASELEDTYIVGGYADAYWPDLAKAMSDYLNSDDSKALKSVFDAVGDADSKLSENGYAIYSAVESRDAKWPRNWAKWHNDTVRVHKKAPFMAWNNAWYNAPAAFWPVSGQHPIRVHGNAHGKPYLFFQATNDAATPYQGGLDMARRFPNAHLVVEKGGHNHGISMSGNTCLDGYLNKYLASGSLPANKGLIDATCKKLPDPGPTDFVVLQQTESTMSTKSARSMQMGAPAQPADTQLARNVRP